MIYTEEEKKLSLKIFGEDCLNGCILCEQDFIPGETGNELGFCIECQERADFPYDLDAYYKAYDNGEEVFKGFDTMSRGILEKYRKKGS